VDIAVLSNGTSGMVVPLIDGVAAGTESARAFMNMMVTVELSSFQI